MKAFLFFFIVLFQFYFGTAQVINDQSEPQVTQDELELSEGAFVPHPRLLQEDRWTRVSEYRFECQFLRLAVEFKDHNYVLIEMDGEKRVLAKNINYAIIKNKIVELTINSRPNFDNIP